MKSTTSPLADCCILIFCWTLSKVIPPFAMTLDTQRYSTCTCLISHSNIASRIQNDKLSVTYFGQDKSFNPNSPIFVDVRFNCSFPSIPESLTTSELTDFSVFCLLYKLMIIICNVDIYLLFHRSFYWEVKSHPPRLPPRATSRPWRPSSARKYPMNSIIATSFKTSSASLAGSTEFLFTLARLWPLSSLMIMWEFH